MVFATLPDPSWLADVGPVPGIDAVVWDPKDPAPRVPVEVVVAPYIGAARHIANVATLPGVRLVQLLTAGFDGILEQLPSRIAVANAAGLHDDSTAELAVALTLAAQRGIPDIVRDQGRGHWPGPIWRPSLADRRVLLVGYGSVGRAIVRRLLPFGAEVTAVASRPRPGDDLVELVRGVEELPILLRDSEIVIVVVPLRSQTYRLVDDGFLAALPDDALVVNVARGPVADTDAILRQAGRLRFALDVTDPEPLPPGHPLWSAPGVLISPHVGGLSSAMRPRALRLLRDQLGRVGADDEPVNIVGHGRLGEDGRDGP